MGVNDINLQVKTRHGDDRFAYCFVNLSGRGPYVLCHQMRGQQYIGGIAFIWTEYKDSKYRHGYIIPIAGNNDIGCKTYLTAKQLNQYFRASGERMRL